MFLYISTKNQDSPNFSTGLYPLRRKIKTTKDETQERSWRERSQLLEVISPKSLQFGNPFSRLAAFLGDWRPTRKNLTLFHAGWFVTGLMMNLKVLKSTGGHTNYNDLARLWLIHPPQSLDFSMDFLTQLNAAKTMVGWVIYFFYFCVLFC